MAIGEMPSTILCPKDGLKIDILNKKLLILVFLHIKECLQPLEQFPSIGIDNAIPPIPPEIINKPVYECPYEIIDRLHLEKASVDVALYEAVYQHVNFAIIDWHLFAVSLYYYFLHIAHHNLDNNNSMIQIIKVMMRFNKPFYLLAVFCDMLHLLLRLLLKAFFPYPILNFRIEIFHYKRPVIGGPQVIKHLFFLYHFKGPGATQQHNACTCSEISLFGRGDGLCRSPACAQTFQCMP